MDDQERELMRGRGVCFTTTPRWASNVLTKIRNRDTLGWTWLSEVPNFTRFGLWNLCSLQGFGLWKSWSLLGLFGVLTLQSVWGAQSCSQGLILSKVIQIASCPLNA
ncbi:hypothetical protein JHK82_035173 [Glycine max]|nr:hypothetical protein JHK85_035894 [Glycine max]KAG5111904.1 hypothetical protein JHK82_035173 [Glycine max]